jgi:hypothetical protein
MTRAVRTSRSADSSLAAKQERLGDDSGVLRRLHRTTSDSPDQRSRTAGFRWPSGKAPRRCCSPAQAAAERSAKAHLIASSAAGFKRRRARPSAGAGGDLRSPRSGTIGRRGKFRPARAHANPRFCAPLGRPRFRRSPCLALRVGPSSRAGSRGSSPTPESGFGTRVLVEWRRRCWSRSAAAVSPRAGHFRFDKLGVSWQAGSRLARAAQTLSLGWGKETSPGSDQRRYRLSSMGSVLVAR